MIYNELKQHGRADFPFGFYHVDAAHPKYEMAFHWHADLEVIRVLRGELVLTLDKRTYRLQAGEIAFVNSETVHGATPADCEYECIVFNVAFLKTGNEECDGFLDNLLSHSLFFNERPDDPVAVDLTHEIFNEIATNDSPFKVLGLFLQLLGEIQQKKLFISHLPPSLVQDEKKVLKLKAALKYIREHFADDVALEDMASVAGFSCKYFCKLFKDLTGTTPVNYLMTYRIERAARKLLSTDKTVTQIGYDCGFNDVSYFIKTFKAFKGVSPKDYRKR